VLPTVDGNTSARQHAHGPADGADPVSPTPNGPTAETICNICRSTVSDLVFTKAGFAIVRCAGCGLLYVRNPPGKKQLERLYSFADGYHGELAQASAAVARHRAEAQANLRVLAKYAAGGRLLDIGCSTGLFLVEARSAGWSTKGAELSQDSARIGREQHGLDIDSGELSADRYAPGSFDAITMWDVIEHVPDPLGTLGIARTLLARDGLLVLKTPNSDGLYPRASLRVAHLIKYWGHPEPPGHLYQFSAATLTRLLDAAGFELVDIVHRRIPISYSFGDLRGWLRTPQWFAYCLGFAPFAMVGPYLRLGDDITAVARKRPASRHE
jgi:2-polyprenyl-3-methyl-5-hydroxy-6-metoxy-1,4-benzoquinol methylase